MDKSKLLFTVDQLTQLAPARSLSLLPIEQLQGKEFKFVDTTINKTYLTEEQLAEIEEDPLKKLEATTFLYIGAGHTIGLRASSLINLRVMTEKLTTAKAKTALTKAKKDSKMEDFSSLLYSTLLKEKEEHEKGSDEAGFKEYKPSFPDSFKVIVADEVIFDGVTQQGKDGIPTDIPAKSYPMQAYEKFQDEVESRTLAAKARVNDAGEAYPFNISELFNDLSFRSSLRGTPLVNGGKGAQAYKTMYVEPFEVSV